MRQPVFLLLETATPVCSVALSQGDRILAIRESDEEKSHSAKLTLFMKEVLDEAAITPSSVDAIAVSKGPGSYTGLRIGVSATKGFAYGNKIPVIGVSTLQALSFSAISHPSFTNHKKKYPSLVLCPMLDARRMEVYTAMFDQHCQPISAISAEIIDENSFKETLQNHPILIFGDGSDKIKEILKHENAIFQEGIMPSAKHLLTPALESFKRREFENTAYFEPYYLKDFIATIPKKKLF